MSADDWGSYEWNERHFPSEQLDAQGDTWGMRWKGMDKARHRSYLRLVADDLKKSDPVKFLDLGCALCDFTLKAWNLNKRNKVWAMDLSPTATKWNTQRFPQFACFVGAAPEIPVDGQFDLIFILEILCYLKPEGRQQTIRNASRKLLPGGKVMFSGVLDGGVRHHTIAEVEGLFRDDFVIEKVHYNHWDLYRRVIEYPLMNLDQRFTGVAGTLSLPREEYRRRIGGSSAAKKFFLGLLRGVRPLSTGALKAASWVTRRIIGSVLLVRLLQLPSKLFGGPGNADEMVVLAVRK